MAEGYPTGLAEAEGAVLEPLLPAARPGGRPRTPPLRRVIEAIWLCCKILAGWVSRRPLFIPDALRSL